MLWCKQCEYAIRGLMLMSSASCCIMWCSESFCVIVVNYCSDGVVATTRVKVNFPARSAVLNVDVKRSLPHCFHLQRKCDHVVMLHANHICPWRSSSSSSVFCFNFGVSLKRGVINGFVIAAISFFHLHLSFNVLIVKIILVVVIIMSSSSLLSESSSSLSSKSSKSAQSSWWSSSA